MSRCRDGDDEHNFSFIVTVQLYPLEFFRTAAPDFLETVLRKLRKIRPSRKTNRGLQDFPAVAHRCNLYLQSNLRK